jgi:hypothetical protein
MTLALAKLQQTFSAALHYQAKGEECNIESDLFTADERMQIYRNNFIMSLSEVLEATYPMVCALVGDECFTQLARQHVLRYPLEEGDVTYYGEHFCDTIERFPAVVDAAPYASEVARFEWHIDLAQQLQGSIRQPEDLWPLARLSEVPPEEQPMIHFHLAPGVIPFHSQYAVFSLRQAIEQQSFDGLELNETEQGAICCINDGRLWTQSLDSDAFSLLQYIHSGCTLGEIPPEQLPHLNFLVESELVAGFSLAR